MLIVQKFGGTSLADEACMTKAARRVLEQRQAGHQVVVVVSAQGHTTDRLLEKAAGLPENRRELDALLACGEQMSAALMAMTLQKLGCPAVSLTGWQAGLETDSTYGDARIRRLRPERLKDLLAEGKTAVVTGFQGIDARGDITTLGRGGSDTTAVALAAFLQADRCMIFTDVDGVYDKDPRQHPDAVRYETLSYEAMLALAQAGAQVLHYRCVELAAQYGMALQVLSTFRQTPGTLVC